MKIFVDSADIDEIRQADEYGVCDGVTTNPSLIKKAVEKLKRKGDKTGMEDYIKKICKTVGRGKSVSLEVISTDAEGMIIEADTLYRKFNRVAGNVAIKIPVSTSTNERDYHYEGLKAIKMISRKGIPVNATLIMTPEQSYLAAKAGAAFVSPFAGRIDDMLRKNMKMKFKKTDYYPEEGMKKRYDIVHDNGIVSGVDLIKKTYDIFKKHDIKTEIIAASIRNSRQTREVAVAGAHIATVPFPVIEEMVKHPKTMEGIVNFSNDVVPEYRNLFR